MAARQRQNEKTTAPQAQDPVASNNESGNFMIAVVRLLTHYRSAMRFGKRKIYLRGSYQFSIVTI